MPAKSARLCPDLRAAELVLSMLYDRGDVLGITPSVFFKQYKTNASSLILLDIGDDWQ